MEKKSNGKLIALIVLGLLTAFGLVIEIVCGIKYSAYCTSGDYLSLATYSVTCVLLVYYAVAGYKVPHGNLMKYLFLMFAICCLGSVLTVATERSAIYTANNYIRGVVVLMTGFVAGRLDRFKQNIILMSIIGVMMLFTSILQVFPYAEINLIDLLYCFTFFLLWVDLMFAYILRYKEHKETGLADK